MPIKSAGLAVADLSVLSAVGFGTLLFRYGLTWPSGPENVNAAQLSPGVWVVATLVLVTLAVGVGALLGLYTHPGPGQTALRAFMAITLGCALFAGLGLGFFSLGMQWPTSVVNMGVLVVLGTPAVVWVHRVVRSR